MTAREPETILVSLRAEDRAIEALATCRRELEHMGREKRARLGFEIATELARDLEPWAGDMPDGQSYGSALYDAAHILHMAMMRCMW